MSAASALTVAQLADAQADPDVGCIVDAPHPDAPLVITFGFVSWDALNRFDFWGRAKKLEASIGRPINRILVRDTANMWYQHGVNGLGVDVESTAASLRELIERVQPISVATVGQSMGAYGAILFGALLGVDRVLAFGPLSYLRSDWARRDGDTRWLPVMEKLERFAPARPYDDLRALLDATPKPPRVHVVIGTQAAPDGEPPNMDRLHAERLAGRPDVSVEQFVHAPHAVVQWLGNAGHIDRVLKNGLLPDGAGNVVGAPAALPQAPAGLAGPQAADRQPFTDGWRGWIAENLAQGLAVDHLLPILVANGFHPGEAQRELDKAARSPYLPTAMRLAQRVAKREWALEVQRKTRSLLDSNRVGPTVERRHRLSREEFLSHHYSANRPVVITGMMDDWPALNWTPQQLSDAFFNQEVQVQTGRQANRRYEMEAAKHRKTMLFGDFMRQVMHGGESNDLYMTANNGSANAAALAGLWKGIVQVPEYLDAGNPASLGFFWIGPAGTVTPTHHDLTNNFMAQVTGRKRVLLVDGLHAARIYNDLHVYSDVDLENIDFERFPAMRDVQVTRCELAPGELLFIPVGWWHHVRSLDFSVTVTFTNFVFDNDFSSMYRTYQLV